MSETLDKAKGSISRAGEMLRAAEDGHDGKGLLMTVEQLDDFVRLLAIAGAQANVAQAEALERIGDLLERWIGAGGGAEHVAHAS